MQKKKKHKLYGIQNEKKSYLAIPLPEKWTLQRLPFYDLSPTEKREIRKRIEQMYGLISWINFSGKN